MGAHIGLIGSTAQLATRAYIYSLDVASAESGVPHRQTSHRADDPVDYVNLVRDQLSHRV